MISPQTLLQIICFSFLMIAAFFDLRDGRVSNIWVLVFGGLLIFLQAMLHGWLGLQTASIGALVGFGLFFPLWLLRAMGAADVKTLAVTGFVLGFEGVAQLALFSLLLGCFYGMIVMVIHGNFFSFVIRFKMSLYRVFFRAADEGDWKDLGKTKIPFIPAIVMGYFMILWNQFHGGL